MKTTSGRLTSRQAKERLRLFRPGTRDAEDPEVAAALELASLDPELAAWLERHCVLCEALRAKFRQIPVPPMPYNGLPKMQ